ncbi:MAG: GTPase ObgE [Deltaproteobacteria bacterium]|nr:GTPase ObgE [Deltaproteobacteria bacterium]
MRFVDEAIITVRSGKGGNGCVSFRRERCVPRGGPNGGDGGSGGSVTIRADSRLLTLYDFRHKRVHEAENGRPGMGRMCNGPAGKDLIVEVPLGTIIHEVDEDGRNTLLADLKTHGQEILVAQGGRGGKGNTHFKSSTMRAPRFAQPGEPGVERRIRLELKVMADVGLIGLPNAGKSTFISKVSGARPRIAPFPFTTLTPKLGVVEDDFGRRMILADIPGLIKGAHLGQGLGHTFLRHVERTRCLVHILGADEIGREDPWEGFALVDDELAKFSPGLAGKDQIRVVNKIDLWTPEERAWFEERARDDKGRILFMSALDGRGVDEVMAAIWARWETTEERMSGLEDNPALDGGEEDGDGC